MIVPQDIYFPLYEDKEKFIILITGGRGCERPTQEVIMSDLSVKQIKDIKEGEFVMGDDGQPRRVLSTMRGRGEMFRVHQSSAEDYYVNDAHILSLKKSDSSEKEGRYTEYAKLTDMCVTEYKNKSNRFREHFRGYKVGSIPFEEREVKINPYLLGVWLGDGTSIFPQITTPDIEIENYLNEYADRNNLRLTINNVKGKTKTFRLAKTEGLTNPIMDALRFYNLIGNKHIPQDYISNSENVRLELLAGILDTDGAMARNGYEITQKSEILAKQVKYIADTLGFRTSINRRKALCNGKDCGYVFRVHINGDTWRIPCKVVRKIVKKEDVRKNKDWHLSQLEIESVGIGDWCGICLDGNQRYLHSDGTVTHNSGKSFNASTFIERLTFEMTPAQKIVHQILYTRYTMVSAGISIIPEMLEKVELDGTQKYFKSTKTDIINKMTKSRIMFRGIKTSSGNQTAKLKSIQGITTFVCDEAEEWTSEEEFEKIMLSIRKKGIQNRIIIIMNPCDSNHWVYKRFIENTHKLVEIDGVNVQVSTHPNVLHIHTTYFDNMENLSPEFLKEINDMKANNPDRYAHIVIGRWADVAEGAVFKKWGIVDEFPAECKKVGIGLDFGYSMDPTAIVRCGIWDNRLYLDEVDYRTGLLSTDIVKSLRPWGMKTIADSADPRLIQEIHNGGIRIYAVEKGAGSINAGIDKMQSLEIFVTKRSYNLQNELRNYVWDKDKDGRYINTPVDANNHCFRGDTLITTINGDIPIKDIRVGDYVLTRNGYKKVLKKHNNGVRKVIEKEVFIGFEKRTFFATLEHKFNANGKWKKYGRLTKGDKLFVLSNLTGECTNGIQMGNTPIITIGNLDTETNRARCCIMPFTNSIMGKFRMERLSTTLTTIRSITRLKTLKRFQEVNIIGYIRRKLTILSEWVLTQKAHIQNQIGIKEELRQLPDYRAKRECASNVADDSQQQMFISDFAQRNAITNGSTPRLNVRQKWCANTAESHSWGTSILSPNAVQKNAHINCKQVTDVKTISESYCEVYDLTIEGEHEYFANGVLVHNCIDAARYWVLGELLGKIQKPKDLTGIFTH